MAVDVLFEPPELPEPPVEPPVELAVPLPAGFAVEPASAAGPLGCAEEADVSDGPSPRTPLHAVRVSAASVIAVAASSRVVRADMGDPPVDVAVGVAMCAGVLMQRPPGRSGRAACLDGHSLGGDPSRPPQPAADTGRRNADIGSDLGE